RRRHTRFSRDWSSDVCSSDLVGRRSAYQYRAFPTSAARPPRVPLLSPIHGTRALLDGYRGFPTSLGRSTAPSPLVAVPPLTRSSSRSLAYGQRPATRRLSQAAEVHASARASRPGPEPYRSPRRHSASSVAASLDRARPALTFCSTAGPRPATICGHISRRDLVHAPTPSCDPSVPRLPHLGAVALMTALADAGADAIPLC